MVGDDIARRGSTFSRGDNERLAIQVDPELIDTSCWFKAIEVQRFEIGIPVFDVVGGQTSILRNLRLEVMDGGRVVQSDRRLT